MQSCWKKMASQIRPRHNESPWIKLRGIKDDFFNPYLWLPLKREKIWFYDRPTVNTLSGPALTAKNQNRGTGCGRSARPGLGGERSGDRRFYPDI